jgi:hypothetical protein
MKSIRFLKGITIYIDYPDVPASVMVLSTKWGPKGVGKFIKD